MQLKFISFDLCRSIKGIEEEDKPNAKNDKGIPYPTQGLRLCI